MNNLEFQDFFLSRKKFCPGKFLGSENLALGTHLERKILRFVLLENSSVIYVNLSMFTSIFDNQILIKKSALKNLAA